MSLYDIDNKTQVDEFGIDHSDFSLRDEIEYNMQRAKEKEQQQCMLPQSYKHSSVNNMQNMPKTNWIDVVNAGIIGSGEGLLGGIERLANGISGGKYGKILDANFDNSYTNRQNRLQNYANSVNLGNINRMSNTLIDVSGRLLPYAYGINKILK